MAKSIDQLVTKLDNISNLDLEKFLEQACILVENKAREDCPVDTGRLRNSITHEVEDNEGYVGTNVEYAPYVEFGTYKQEAHPFLQPALDANKDNIKKLLQKHVKEVLEK